MRDLLDSVEPSVTRAKEGTIWESVHRERYDARLADVRSLVTNLSEGFSEAGTALLGYADKVEEAKRHLETGLDAEQELDNLVSSVASAVTRTAQLAEPMRRWEDIRSTTGVLDWFAELGMDVDEIRDEATRAYEQAEGAFSRALSIEKGAREECLAKLKAAYETLPDFRGGDFKDVAVVIGYIAPLINESAQARDDPLAQLPGSGEKGDFPSAGGAVVSPALQHIRNRLKSLQEGEGYWLRDVLPGGKEDWIRDNKELINAAAAETGLPPDLIAGIAWIEVGGKPYALDDYTYNARQNAESGWSPVTPEYLPGPLAGDKDETSFGPMAVQIRRGAEVLGYDPENLSEQQRNEVKSALKHPAQNIFIASEYLANLKAESEFANVPADQMTPAQYRELAARYNGGPNWQGSHAQEYGRNFEANLGQAREALR
ncbi:MAG: hypothetical protein ACRDTH_11620 [Pseudonocardiaceae bacterium]